MEKSKGRIPLILFDDFPSYFCNSPAVESSMSEPPNAHGWFDSRSQLLDCLEHRFVELIQSSPVQPPVEGGTDVGATKPELDVIAFADHRILEHVNPGLIIAESEETHPDHRQKGADGTEHGLCWCNTTDILREIQGFDSRIQRGECVIASLWSLGLGIHGGNPKLWGCGKGPEPHGRQTHT